MVDKLVFGLVKSQTGGGDSYAVSARMPPLPLSPVKDLSFWGGEFATDGGTTNIFEVKNMANCETCKKVQNAPESVLYIVHESSMARMERQIKRLWITVLVLIVMLVTTNGAWIWYESQMETIYQEVTQEADTGTNNFVGGDVIGETDYKNS